MNTGICDVVISESKSSKYTILLTKQSLNPNLFFLRQQQYESNVHQQQAVQMSSLIKSSKYTILLTKQSQSPDPNAGSMLESLPPPSGWETVVFWWEHVGLVAHLSGKGGLGRTVGASNSAGSTVGAHLRMSKCQKSLLGIVFSTMSLKILELEK